MASSWVTYPVTRQRLHVSLALQLIFRTARQKRFRGKVWTSHLDLSDDVQLKLSDHHVSRQAPGSGACQSTKESPHRDTAAPWFPRQLPRSQPPPRNHTGPVMSSIRHSPALYTAAQEQGTRFTRMTVRRGKAPGPQFQVPRETSPASGSPSPAHQPPPTGTLCCEAMCKDAGHELPLFTSERA